MTEERPIENELRYHAPGERDYSSLWWADGWRGRSEGGGRVLRVRSGYYDLALDVEAVSLPGFGARSSSVGYRDSIDRPGKIETLPESDLSLEIETNGGKFRCVRGAVDRDDTEDFPVRLIEVGRFVQRFDVRRLQFRDEDGNVLDADCRLEVTAWPRHVTAALEVVPRRELGVTDVGVEIEGHGGESRRARLDAGDQTVVSRTVRFSETAPTGKCGDLSVVERGRGAGERETDYDPTRGLFSVDLPVREWSVGDHPDRLDQFDVTVENHRSEPLVLPLAFELEGSVTGITGMTPVIRDSRGKPTGIPVQISKNWHGGGERSPLYDGRWFHGLTQIQLPPNETASFEFDVTYARWGGVPAASHAQLCLIGWGTNQLWEQAAIGSWGESITYDPEVCLGRSMIDDVRPLMVTAMSEGSDRWTWTNNVGGGDFLVSVDGSGTRRYLSRMRASYDAYGPNLTDVTYHGVTDDGTIQAQLNVSTPRTDDLNRAYHRMRYDVTEPVEFDRLAFYQLGADGYNNHQFERLARGNADGVVREWSFEKGGETYDQRGVECPGNTPWFSLHRGARPPADVDSNADGGAWANRGLVVRSWDAQIGGRDVGPHASFYGTEDQVPSMNVELSPPPGVDRLEPGDYVDALVELVVVPQSAGDYYGPNENLRADLEQNGETWKPVYRQATGNDVDLVASRGRVTNSYPPVVETDEADVAAFTLSGGLAYLPVTVTGLTSHAGYELVRLADGEETPVEQAVHGNDFWQTGYVPADGTWSRTYNVRLDTPTDEAVERRFILRPSLR